MKVQQNLLSFKTRPASAEQYSFSRVPLFPKMLLLFVDLCILSKNHTAVRQKCIDFTLPLSLRTGPLCSARLFWLSSNDFSALLTLSPFPLWEKLPPIVRALTRFLLTKSKTNYKPSCRNKMPRLLASRARKRHLPIPALGKKRPRSINSLATSQEDQESNCRPSGGGADCRLKKPLHYVHTRSLRQLPFTA